MHVMLRDRIVCFVICYPQNMKVTMYGTKAVESHLDVWGPRHFYEIGPVALAALRNSRPIVFRKQRTV